MQNSIILTCEKNSLTRLINESMEKMKMLSKSYFFTLKFDVAFVKILSLCRVDDLHNRMHMNLGGQSKAKLQICGSHLAVEEL